VSDFFRYPHTSHLAWLGEGQPRDDKVLSPADAKMLLSEAVVVEEKLDGANLGLSLSPAGSLRAQNRSHFLAEPYTGQFFRLASWLTLHTHALCPALTPDLILFGEWCAARHSLSYDRLPDWFLLFDVLDRSQRAFWSSPRRNALAKEVGLSCVPQVAHGRISLQNLENMLATESSRYRQGPLEGLVVRSESADWCRYRAKLVRPDFAQAIDAHWRKRTIEWNRVHSKAAAQ
jgi:ATP-dependent RNA circularization protein (DNA/RNA ligase family)